VSNRFGKDSVEFRGGSMAESSQDTYRVKADLNIMRESQKSGSLAVVKEDRN